MSNVTQATFSCTNLTEYPQPLGYNPFPPDIQPYLAAIILEVFLYGIYTVLFSICAYILMRRRRYLHWILPVLTCAMFSIATADVAYTLFLLTQHILKGRLSFQHMRPKYWLYVTNNILADSTLLYRCYVVWGHDIRVIVLPILLFVASMVCGYLFEGSSTILFANSWVYVMLTFILNVILTLLTAGRIWWLSRQGTQILDRELRSRYYVALAAILESGFTISLYMLPDLILANIVLDNGLIQIVGIAPTLIVVQVGLGRAINPIELNCEGTMETIRIAEITSSQVEAMKGEVPISFKKPIESDAGESSAYQDRARSGEHRITVEVLPQLDDTGKNFSEGKAPPQDLDKET